ncbi:MULTISPECIES: triose-phosphate isomerase [Spirosoma]|uniref:Triosephosphate isomerase n=1 Tax=Spirosoma liriopis TaxID=2937440 RepID=A0ABT0HKT8_9BACT|nr:MULTISPECIES: triose-phosphate isomerase [Spirosoma]MCK8492215.1 triose-phosphate isomerase [Spirosoma liriopis]UHG91632.1 triose-phosphate isomerase [Spirosoma oryzicola]
MRKKIVAGNWKMNKTFEEAKALLSEVINMVKDEVTGDVQVVLCPPSLYLTTSRQYIAPGGKISLGAQNCHEKASGAYTGEISAPMLQSIGVEYVILGHSERRQYFEETNAQLAEKVNSVLENGLTPIFCCGESRDLRENGDYIGFVKDQLTESLFHLSAESFSKVVIAYEPIWAIGTGLTASSAQAQDMHFELRQHIAGQYGDEVAQETSILYGGSANEKNAAELFAQPDVDGGLIGGASLKSREFTNVIKARQ